MSLNPKTINQTPLIYVQIFMVNMVHLLQLNRLSENGEESLLLTATATDLQNASPIYSKLGGGFFEKEAVSLQEIGKKFQTYCQGQWGTRVIQMNLLFNFLMSTSCNKHITLSWIHLFSLKNKQTKR